MDGENNGNTHLKMDELGEKPPIFGNIPKNPPALPACLVEGGLMMDCLSVLSFCLYSLS